MAGAAGAFVHGRAAERVPYAHIGDVRGVTLEEIVAELRNVWELDARPTRYPVLAELPPLS
jgi:hypothetical protein